MSRSGYGEDYDGEGISLDLWRNIVTRSLNGKRGQAFLKEMIEALDAMPKKNGIM